MFVTVIIPTYNRYESLKQSLRALAEQDYPKDQFEVIVVDDGSKDNTAEIVHEPLPYPLKYIRQANQGATVARNRAADEARGELLVFLDDDIAVVPGFLKAFAQAHQTPRVVAVGNLQPVARQEMSIFEKIYGEATATPASPDGQSLVPVGYMDLLTGMSSVRRADFFEIGKLLDLIGDGRVAWGDVDFGYRAMKLGFCFLRCMDAIGYHDDYSIRDFVKCAQRWERTSESAVKLFAAYPEIRPSIAMFVDKEPIAWGKDSAGMVARKTLRQVFSTRPVIWALQNTALLFEKILPNRLVLGSLYRWTIGGYIFRGYRSGLNKYGS